MHQEKIVRPASGWFPLLICIVLMVGGIAALIYTANQEIALPWGPIGSAVLIGLSFLMMFGFMAIPPNESRVLLLFGEYKGSVRESGFFFVNPFFSKKKVSLRIRNFETGSQQMPDSKDSAGKVVKGGRTQSRPSKVNDRDGNPIEISAVVVWRVVNTAEALFEVDDFEHFVEVQSEAALRNMASKHPYDAEDGAISLRGDTAAIGDELKSDIQDRLDKAGVDVIEARISFLAYAPEIAAAMLQRQQAQAVVAARTKIVEGAVGMVEMALEQLKRDDIIDLDDERRATMVSNLMVVLCSDRHTQPVINTGSLYN